MNLKSIILLILFFTSFFTFSQENLEETKQIADKLFEDEKYIEATPYYLRLLANQPRDHSINYHYGACLLFNASKSQDVFKYLNYAVTNPNVEAEANFFLGKAFHLNYQFNDAIKYYNIYQLKAGEKAKETFDVKRQIEMCENGKKLITTITEMIVLDKKEIEKDKFFRIYDLSDIGGNLLVTAEFQTKLDEKKAHIPLIHFPSNPTVIYYSSYGETGKTGKDIYVQRRLPTGGWGLPQVLKGDVNTKFDEEYPYMHPDGEYLYFSSKGHNSMGGFDVFRCKYDAETDMFGKAENMDFAVSSPNDDLFYVVDSLNKNAYFGSNRQSEEGKLFVYKVRVDRVPLNMSVIKGEFSSVVNPQMKKVLIDVKDYASGEFIGNFNSNEKGVYLITFPKGGKYEFEIRVGENPQVYKYIASIPFQKEFKPLKQKIIHEMQEDRENVKVIDLFNEEVEDPQAVFAQVIRMKSILTPNVSAEELARLEKELKDKEILKELGLGNLSLTEVGYLLEEEVKDAKRAEDGTKEIENKIYAQVIDNTTEIKRLDGLIKSKIDQANLSQNDKRKYKLLKEAERALKTQEELKLITDKSVFFADSLSKATPKGSHDETVKVANFSEHFNELLKENKQKEAYSYLNDNKDAIKKIIDEKTLDPLQELIERGFVLDDEISILQPKDDQYDQDLKKIDADVAELERSKNGAKKKVIEEIDILIKAKNSERTLILEERIFNSKGLNEKKSERSSLRIKIDELEAIYNVKSNRIVTKEEMNLAVSNSKATNSDEVRSKISDQIAQLVLINPDVKEVDYEDLEKDLGSVVTSSRGKSDKIKSDATLSPQEKANKLKALDREMLVSINNEILNTEKSLKQNPGDLELKKKLESFKTAKTLISSALDLPEDEDEDNDNGSSLIASDNLSPTQSTLTLNNNSSSNQTEKINISSSDTGIASTQQLSTNTTLDEKGKENLIESINSNYNEKIAQINNNKDLSELQKTDQLQREDTELLKSIDEVINSIENSLQQNPSNASLSKKIVDLKSIKAEVESKVASREKILANNKRSIDNSSTELESKNTNVVSSNLTTPLDAKAKENLIENISSSYNDNVKGVNTNASLSESEKLNQLQVLDKELLISINKELSTITSGLGKNSNDSDLIKKENELKLLKSDIESSISSRESVVNSISQPLSQKLKNELIDGLSPIYNVKITEIKNNSQLSESEKSDQLQKADKELITLISKEITALENNSKNNPDSQLIKDLSDLKTIKNELEKTVSNRESSIGNSSNVLSAKEKESVIELVNSSYNEKSLEINTNTSLSLNEKTTQIQQLDKALVLDLNEALIKVDAELKSSPTNSILLKKQSDLKIVKSEIEGKLNVLSSSNNLNSTEISEVDNKSLIESIKPSYNEKLTQINSNSSLSESNKLTQIQKLDKELLISISNEMSRNEEALKINSSDNQLINKQSSLVILKKEIENKISDQDVKLTLVAEPMNQVVKANIIESINSKYDKNIDAINKNTDLSVTEKLNKLQELDYSLVKGIDQELISKQAELKKNSTDVVLLKRIENLNSVKSEIEESIASRETVIASSSNSIDDKVKTELIESISSSYNEKVSEIKENEYLLDGEKLTQLQSVDRELLVKIEKEMIVLEKSLAENSLSPIEKRKLDGLKVVKIDLENNIESRDKSKSPSYEDDVLATKSELIETFKPGYNEQVVEIKSHAINTQLQKLEELQKLDQELLISIKEEVKKATIASKKKSKDEKLKKSKADIIELQVLAESVIAERNKEIELLESNSVSEKQKSDLISEIKPDYTIKVTQINDSKLDHAKELQELMKEETALVSVLERKVISVKNELKNSPNDESLKLKLNIVIATKLESQNKLDDLMKQSITLEANDIDQTALISRVDSTYVLDIKKYEISSSPVQPSEYLARELKLQEKIKSQILENEKVLALNFKLEIAAENQILNQKLIESKNKAEEYKKGRNIVSDLVVNSKVLELRSEVLGKSSNELDKEYSSLADLKAQENIVNAYVEVLKSRIEKINLANPNQDQNLNNQKQLLESELNIAEVKSKDIVAKIELAKNSSADNSLTSTQLKVLIEKENSLKKQLENTSLTKKERLLLEKELLQVQDEKNNESNSLITKNLAVRKSENVQKSSQLKQLGGASEISKLNADLAISQNMRLSQEADVLIAKSDETNNSIDKNELLTEAIQKQTLADEIVQSALEDNVIRAAISNKVSTLDSKEELEDKKRKYSIEIGEITGQIDEIDAKMLGLNSKKSVELIKQKEDLISEKQLREKQLEEVQSQLSEIKEIPKTINENAIQADVSLSEEKRLIASKEYLEYSINANKALRIEKQITENEVVLTQKRQAAKEIIAMSLDKSSNVTDAEVQQSIQNVITVEDEIKRLTNELKEKQTVSSALLSKNDSDALRMQNLLKRGVEPEFNESLALVEQQRIPAVGLKVVSPQTPVNDYSVSNPIPVDVKNPTGLVYRIQVGAFTKPIAQDMYKSFSPVSGEKLASGVIRYMAGYFNNSKTVDDAFSQVKSLGYSDAFIVAFCDNERIPLADARKLELSGQCISTESREFVIAMAATPTSSIINTNDLSYNNAPGAAKAIPAEAHLGLFYTVQVGVYNKPATAHQLKNIDPIVSKRMPNGQIRYSSGMYSSIDAAKPKKGEAIEKGVKDAFITAYYKGERLTLSQAAAVLKKEGDVILEKIDSKLLASVSNKENTETIKEISKSKEELSSYNKSPGAVSAKAVEAHLGLFFTVQIGVYSKPANSKQLNYVTPLITKKLPNGQLRYSSGMYSTIEAAEPKRIEILEKGVKHAYITAYYKGERITITEAKELLRTNGDIILEKLDK